MNLFQYARQLSQGGKASVEGGGRAEEEVVSNPARLATAAEPDVEQPLFARDEAVLAEVCSLSCSPM